MKLLNWLGRSGMWAGLLAVALFVVAYLVKAPVALFTIAWLAMAAAALYAGRYSPDAKRAKALQARAHAQRAKAAGTTP